MRIMKNFWSATKKLIASNKQLLVGLLIGVAIALPTGLYITERNSNNTLGSKLSAQKVTKQDDSNTKPEASIVNPQPTNGAQSQITQTPVTKSVQSNTSSSANQPTQQAAPTPTTLANCFYQNGATSGQNCPYSPPPSWSSLSLYNCYNGSGNYVACSGYTDTVSIYSQNYTESGSTPTNFCVFTFKNGTYKPVRVSISTGETRCFSDQAMTYDPWASN